LPSDILLSKPRLPLSCQHTSCFPPEYGAHLKVPPNQSHLFFFDLFLRFLFFFFTRASPPLFLDTLQYKAEKARFLSTDTPLFLFARCPCVLFPADVWIYRPVAAIASFFLRMTFSPLRGPTHGFFGAFNFILSWVPPHHFFLSPILFVGVRF